MPDFHPELTRARLIPQLRIYGWMIRLLQKVKIKGKPAPADMTIEDSTIPGPAGSPPIRLRIYRPKNLTQPAPALYWIHGGGFIQGAPEQDDNTCLTYARDLGIVVVSVAYRLAPRHPYPAPLDDTYAGLQWLYDNTATLGVDPHRIALGGASAGLAAALAHLAHDRGDLKPIFQLLVYPMLDDRTVLRTDIDARNMRGWIPQNNRIGWTSYLGQQPGIAGVPEYAAPARRAILTGLPPAWIGVGTNDLFHDEDIAYARRLTAAGVDCELHVVPGAFHGFDVFFARTEVAQQFLREQTQALRAAFDRATAPPAH